MPLADIVVVGGINADLISRPAASLQLGTSNPGTTTCTPGGVGRNIAEALARLDVRVALVSVTGDDPIGASVLAQTRDAGVDIDAVRVLAGATTGTYTAVLDEHGQLCVAVSSMGVLHGLDLHDIERAAMSVVAGGVLVLDANVAPVLLAHALVVAEACGIQAVIEPVSVTKAAGLAAVLGAAPLSLLTPNLDELRALVPHRAGDLAGACRSLHDNGVAVVWVRAGAEGSWIAQRGHDLVHIATEPQHDVADVTGAGDVALAGYLWAHQRGYEPVAAAHAGTAAALATLRAAGSVTGMVSQDVVEAVRRAASQFPTTEESS